MFYALCSLRWKQRTIENDDDKWRAAGVKYLGRTEDMQNKASRDVWVPTLIIAVSAILRFPALFSDFWLDEVWSLSETLKLKSAVEVLTKFNIDNNHHLNSLFLYALGDQRYWEFYRIPSYLSGVAIVLFSWLIGRSEGFLEAVLASTLTGSSYLLIHYSSEARGYSSAVMFSLAGFYALRRFADQPTWSQAVAFWVCVSCGTLSHLTFMSFFLAALIWFPLERRRRKGDGAQFLWPFARAFCVPGAFVLFFFLAVIQRIVLAPVPYYNKGIDVVVNTLSFIVGGPPSGPAAVGVSLSVLCILVTAILWQRWRDRPLGAFYFVVVIYPALLVMVGQRSMLYPRYFLVSVAFALLAMSSLLAELLRRGQVARVVVAAVLGLYVVGNALYTEQLIRFGRGGYRQAVAYMGEHTSEAIITVASNHYFSRSSLKSQAIGSAIIIGENHYFPIHMLLDYYRKYVVRGKKLVYYSGKECPAAGTQWFVLDTFDRKSPVPSEFQDPNGNTYRHEQEYPHSVMSGETWHLYERVPWRSAVGSDLLPGVFRDE